jgi:hypothetical protein
MTSSKEEITAFYRERATRMPCGLREWWIQNMVEHHEDNLRLYAEAAEKRQAIAEWRRARHEAEVPF